MIPKKIDEINRENEEEKMVDDYFNIDWEI